MDTLEKMKRLSVLNTQAANAQKNLDQINDLSLDDFLKFAEPYELDELRAKIKSRYEGYLRAVMEEAKALLGDTPLKGDTPCKVVNGPYGQGRYEVPMSKLPQFNLELQHCENAPFKNFALRKFEELWRPYKLFLP